LITKLPKAKQFFMSRVTRKDLSLSKSLLCSIIWNGIQVEQVLMNTVVYASQGRQLTKEISLTT
jgi:hypothetical protein